MSTWPSVRLDDCANIVSGATPDTSESSYWGGSICWATPKDLSELGGAYIADTPRKITDSGLRSCAASVLPPESVLFSSRAPIGHVAINITPMATNQGFKSFIPNRERLDPKYLYYWLRANRPYLEGLGNGATFKEVSKAIVSRIQIPLPPLPEQRRIAAILDKADALRGKRQAAIQKLDELTHSIFLDMFGDPATNPNRWPVAALHALGRVMTGSTPPSAKEGMFDGPIPFVTPGDLESDRPVRRTVTEQGAKESRTVEAGATLVCCIGATIGKIGMAATRSAFNQQLNAIEWGDSVEPEYGLAVMRFFKPTIIAWGSSTTLPILKKSAFERIEIPVPPRKLQQVLAERVGCIESLRKTAHEALDAHEVLFAALQSRGFQGGL